MNEAEGGVDHTAIYIYNLRECDPRKCTAQKLGRLGLARVVSRLGGIPSGAVLLYPSSETMVSCEDRPAILQRGIAAVDCSWNRLRGIQGTERFSVRQLPFLLAGNPTNYAIAHKLSTVEALAASLYIVGLTEEAERLLSKFKWGPTFLALNREPLSSYARAKGHQAVRSLSEEYDKGYSIRSINS